MKNRFIAALLSFVIPGFGQIYNKQFAKGITLLVIENIINKLANINLALMLSLNGHAREALSTVHFDHALFYPGFFALATFDAVLFAENDLNKNGAFWFVISGLVGTMGIIYSNNLPIPVFSVGFTMIVLMLIGTYGCSRTKQNSA
ncbi:hypothetical protein M3182_13330 [Mesobacillus maritimus]|uniref:hypothetical protein n=1 Tax=Mesobacillus maritimus TaxID=1643336 RepID=UPI00203FE550|nr:hypothetical protein [Mesobacillus maritimus]MCM3586716.1 hypothetical protein [Mesobacillus maritimus]MCM3668530.1 hypothetical protein [Mesobacillus maritimus]